MIFIRNQSVPFITYYIVSLTTRQLKYNTSDSDGNRTRVTAVKGRCLNRLTMEPQYLFSYEKTPRVGLEPTTTRLTAECSTIELSRIIQKVYTFKTDTEPFPSSFQVKLPVD